MEENKNIIKHQWTPDWEARYQYTQKQYDNARAMGIDVLKVFLQVVIALNIIPIIFHEKLLNLFGGYIKWLYASWICILISVLIGFIAYFFVFEGYFHQAHFESLRWLGGTEKYMKEMEKKADFLFDLAHWLGIVAMLSFLLAISFVIIPIMIKIFLK